MKSVDLDYMRKIQNCLPFADEGAGIQETQQAIGEMIAELGELRKQLADLRVEVVGKLPKTKDGKLFAQGTVYVPGMDGGQPHVFDFDAIARWVDDRPYIGHRWGEEIKNAYSTREAALTRAGKDHT